jgi:hypothetical protein
MTLDPKRGPLPGFQKAGDILKYVQKIEYVSGSAGTRVTYMKGDWTTTTPGAQPTLKLNFERVPSVPLGDGRSLPGSC